MAELVNQRYKITKSYQMEDVTIFVEINGDDQITIQNQNGQPQFTFTRSNPDRVMAMALAMHEAAELVTDRKVREG